MHYFQNNISDYMSHTGHLDDMEDLAYRRMIEYCYLHEIGLPKEVSDIARLIRMRTHTEAIAIVLQEFFTLDGDVYKQSRIEREIDKYRAKSAQAREAAEKRWAQNGDSGDADALHDKSAGNAKQEPTPNKQDPRNNSDVIRVHGHWQKVTGRGGELSKKDAGKIRARLKNYSVGLLLMAINGNKLSPYHQGKNDNDMVYNNLELIFRNDDKTQMFIDLFNRLNGKPQPGDGLGDWLNADD